MTLLAIETCTTAGSVAIVRNANRATEICVFRRDWQRGRSHAEILTSSLQDGIKQVSGTSIGWATIDAVAVGVGPGSFTGIRVGVNAARAIGWSLDLPVIPIPSTATLLMGALSTGLVEREQTIVAVIPAQMGLVFAAWNKNAPKVFSISVLVENLKALGTTIVLVGEGRVLVSDELTAAGVKLVSTPSPLDAPQAVTVARLAAAEISDQSSHSTLVERFNWRLVQPLYLRGSGAEEKVQ